MAKSQVQSPMSKTKFTWCWLWARQLLMEDSSYVYWAFPKSVLTPLLRISIFRNFTSLEFHQNFHHPLEFSSTFSSTPRNTIKILTTPRSFPVLFLFPFTPWEWLFLEKPINNMLLKRPNIEMLNESKISCFSLHQSQKRFLQQTNLIIRIVTSKNIAEF